jgi:dihydrofolate synthase/folylpolyglutamate synthase
MLEAAGNKVHVYTSPHLIRFHERIRINGQLISEDELVSILCECERHAIPGGVSYFEVATAAAFTAFARHKADFTILETGLGGRLDATNIVDDKIATVITRLSYDHREYLGTTLSDIAREKAGIMRKDVPCFASAQPDAESVTALRDAAQKIHALLSIGGADWRVDVTVNGFRFADKARTLDLPRPALPGLHQCFNAGLAIASLSVLPQPISADAIKQGLQKVAWPARLQRLNNGALHGFLPPDWELWLDGGHNDSAGEVLAAEAFVWQTETPMPLHLVMGMLTTKKPHEFLAPLLPYVSGITCIAIPDEPLAFAPEDLAAQIRALGVKNVGVMTALPEALKNITRDTPQKKRVMICGSLYLAGHALRLDSPAYA